LQTETFVLVTKAIIILTNILGKIPLPTPLYYRRNSQYRTVGGRKTISGSWLLRVVDTAEKTTNVAFNDSFNNRNTSRAVRNRYTEQFCPQTW